MHARRRHRNTPAAQLPASHRRRRAERHRHTQQDIRKPHFGRGILPAQHRDRSGNSHAAPPGIRKAFRSAPDKRYRHTQTTSRHRPQYEEGHSPERRADLRRRSRRSRIRDSRTQLGPRQGRLRRRSHGNHRGSARTRLTDCRSCRARSITAPKSRPHSPRKTRRIQHAPERCHRRASASV